ncbi:T9SS type A sorting domain-containing protein [candidate division TA06 bacterium]|nr:T9SS type A sorting domain-containing protein [candidate division TA06 bacterium]
MKLILLAVLLALAATTCAYAQADYFTLSPWGIGLDRDTIIIKSNWALELQKLQDLGANEIEGCLPAGESIWMNNLCNPSVVTGRPVRMSTGSEPGFAIPYWRQLWNWGTNGLDTNYMTVTQQHLQSLATTWCQNPGWVSHFIGQEWDWYHTWNDTNWNRVYTALDYATRYWEYLADSLSLPADYKDRLVYAMHAGLMNSTGTCWNDFAARLPRLGVAEIEVYGFFDTGWDPNYGMPTKYNVNDDSFTQYQKGMQQMVDWADSCFYYYENPQTKASDRKTIWKCLSRAGKQENLVKMPDGTYVLKTSYRWTNREEIRASAWLALSRGAKGLKHFNYFSYPSSYTPIPGGWPEKQTGIVDENRIPRDSIYHLLHPESPAIYDWVKELYTEVGKIGPILSRLQCNYAFGVNHLPGETFVNKTACYIRSVTALKPEYNQRDYFEVGTFKDYSLDHYGDEYFILINRYCMPQETLAVNVKINYTPLTAGIGFFVADELTGQAVSPMLPRAVDTSFTITLLPGGGRLLKIIPFASTPKLQAGAINTNFRFTTLSPNISSTLSNDSIQITQKYWVKVEPETMAASPDYIGYYWASNVSDWLTYSNSSIQYLYNSAQNKANIFELQYKIDGGKILTPKFSGQIYFNDDKPAVGSITINNGDQFTNDTLVNVKISGSDAFPGLSQMRFAEAPFGNDFGYANMVKNGTFEDTTNWVLDNTEYYDGFLHLKGVHTGPGPAQIGASAKQIIPGSEINQHRNKLLRYTDDIYAHDVISSYKVVEVFYADAVYPNSVRLLEKSIASDPEVIWKTKSDTFTLKVDTTRAIDRMEISYNIYGIEVPPPPPDDDPLFNTIVVDNIRLERVELRGDTPPPPPPPPDEYVKPYIYDGWVLADTSKSYNHTLSVGDGVKKVYLQLNDLPGNISAEPGWYDDIILDMTLPNSNITLPLTASYINGTVNSYGFSSDLNFESWVLDYKPYSYGDWQELTRSGVNQIDFNPGDLLYTWNTGTLHEGTYLLRLTTYDKAGNVKADTHFVYVVLEPALPISAVTAEFATFNSLPVDATCDNIGNIYVTDTQADKIWKFSPEGDSLLCFGYSYTGQDTLGLNHPKGIAVDDSGNIWITDCYQSKVKKYDSQGSYLGFIGKHGNQQGEFNQPTGITISGNEIYVADHLNGRVQVFNKTGAFTRQFGNNCLNQPAGIAIRNNEAEKLVYVCDSQNDRIAIFDAAGNLVNSLDSLGLDKPWDICFDNNNNLYIADVYNNRVIELDPWHNKLLTFGIQGQEAGEFKLPQGLAVSPDGKYLYLADTHNDRLQRFKMFFDMGALGGPQTSGKRQITNTAPTVFGLSQCYPNPCKQKTSINYQIPKAGNVSLKVYNTLGQVVKILVNENQQPGYYSINWDGRDENKRQAAAGVYFYRLASGEYKNTKKLVLLR